MSELENDRKPSGRPLVPGRLTRLATLERRGGNVSRAAAQLGLDSNLFYHWLRRLRKTEGRAHLPAHCARNLTDGPK